MVPKFKLVILGTTLCVRFSRIHPSILMALSACSLLKLLTSMPIFSVDRQSVGQSKAKCVCAFLQELNDAVKAKFVEESPDTLIETKPSFFSQFTLVIVTQVLCFL